MIYDSFINNSPANQIKLMRNFGNRHAASLMIYGGIHWNSRERLRSWSDAQRFKQNKIYFYWRLVL